MIREMLKTTLAALRSAFCSRAALFAEDVVPRQQIDLAQEVPKASGTTASRCRLAGPDTAVLDREPALGRGQNCRRAWKAWPLRMPVGKCTTRHSSVRRPLPSVRPPNSRAFRPQDGAARPSNEDSPEPFSAQAVIDRHYCGEQVSETKKGQLEIAL
jgi:hypothetical protein